MEIHNDLAGNYGAVRFKFTGATAINVLDIHELAAGKLAALLSRRRARDLFDCRQLLRLDTVVKMVDSSYKPIISHS